MSSVNFGGFSVPPLSNTSTVGSIGESGGASFGDVLKSAVKSVDDVNKSASAQASNLLQGGNADINNVMIAVEKADVSFQLMMQVRNKIVSAYQNIEKVQF